MAMNRRLPVLAFVSTAALLSLTGGRRADGADWPQWRGPERDGKSPEEGLLEAWPEDGPSIVWEVEAVGVGYSSIAVRDGRIFTQGDLAGVEHVIALREGDGGVVWAVQPEPAAERLDQRVTREFERLDRNGDGSIDEVEALRGLRWRFNENEKPAEGDPEKIAATRARRLVEKLDEDGDGELDANEAGDEFERHFASIDSRKEVAEEELATKRTEALFEKLDRDGDGRISRDESRNSPLRRSFRRIDGVRPGERDDESITPEEYHAYLLRFEPGRDGRLTREELSEYYAKRYPGNDGILEASELRRFYGGYRNGQGDGPRGTPTLDGDRLYAEGAMGDLTCLDVETGKTVWHIHLVEDLGGRVPGWGYSESPLVEGDLLIATPGGKEGGLAALDKRTGEVVWRSDEVTQGAHYSSPVAAEIGGERQIIQFARKSVFGVSAADGRFLWEYEGANNGTANCMTPVVHEGHVFVASAYGTGGGLVEIATIEGGGFRAREVYFEKRMQNHHGGLVRVGDEIYGFGSGGLIALDFRRGEILWSDRSVRKGSLIWADGRLYCLGERHEMALVDATPEAYRERGRFRIESRGRPSWAHPAIAAGKLYIRNQEKLTAYDLRATSEPGSLLRP